MRTSSVQCLLSEFESITLLNMLGYGDSVWSFGEVTSLFNYPFPSK